MSSQTRNPFLRLPVSVNTDVVHYLIHADHILQITEHDILCSNVELVNGKQFLVELNMEMIEKMLNQAYGHEIAKPYFGE